MPTGLRPRILLLAFLTVIPLFALIFYNGIEQKNHLTQHAEQNLQNATRMANAELSRTVTVTHEILLTLSKLPAVRNPAMQAECNQLFSSFISDDLHFLNLGVIGTNGITRCSGLPLDKDIDLSDRFYFRRAMTTHEFASGNYQIGRITGKPSINFAYPVQDSKGRILSVIFAAMDLRWLGSMVARLPQIEDTTVNLIDSHGILLARYPPDPARTGKPLNDPALLSVLEAGSGSGKLVTRGKDGVKRFYTYSMLKDLPSGRLYLTLGIPTDKLYAPVRAQVERNLTIISILFLLIFALAWWGSKTLILQPVQALRSAADRLSRGSLSARTGLDHTPSELGQLARSFDHMADELEQREIELQRVNRALKTLSSGNRTLLRGRDELSLLQTMCRIPVDVGGFCFAWVGYKEDHTSKRIRPMAKSGPDEGFLEQSFFTWADTPEGHGPSGTAIRTGRPQVANDLATNPVYEAWHATVSRYGMGSMIAMPLHVGEEVIGVFSVYAEEPDAFATREAELLMEMADDLAFGIENLRLQAKHRQADAALQQMAYQDQLTGLPNRVGLLDQLKEEISRAEIFQQPLALLVLDLNRFREVNDILGFEPGDAMLQAVAPRIRQVVNGDSTIARIGEDEFAVIAPNCDAQMAEGIGTAIRETLMPPLALNELQLDMQASIGIALYPGHSSEAEELVRYATHAVTQAKSGGNEVAVYAAESREENRRRLMLSHQLNNAIRGNELQLYCQPKIDLKRRQVCGTEALTRWTHPVHGAVAPCEFVPVAEHTGLIKPLTYWVLETAVKQHRLWNQEHGLSLPIAINLSAHNLKDKTLIKRIETLLQTWGIEPEQLHLELTESALMENPAHALGVLTTLHNMGLALYIDDFGTGYSSLGYLQKLPVDAIKIDKSFVQAMPQSNDSEVIVTSTIELAHSLGLQVVAEGVEDQQTLERLEQMGCDAAQGYHISRPMDAGTFSDWLNQSPWKPTAVAG
ncbi:MAG: EAL domain-containing protein [Gammaproteobacteria bacterium]|jgi:diguanylate cyclase (GGDEF)-like protein